jgi:hypothetical protein
VPTWADLEILAYQTVAQTAADGDGDRLSAAPGREVGQCVALALTWRDTLFPGGIAASVAADDLVADRKGLLAGLVAAGGWVPVEAPGQVEAMLASTHRGLYAMVVWEPAGQVAGHGKVWHAHRAGPAVRWMDLGTGHGQWMHPGGPPGFAAGHARAVFVSADARVLDPPAATRAGFADLSALLELAPARPVTGKSKKGKDKGRKGQGPQWGQDEDQWGQDEDQWGQDEDQWGKGQGKGQGEGQGNGQGEGEAISSSANTDLKNLAKAYRKEHSVADRKNVAVVRYEINGETGELIGVSGHEHQYLGSVPTPIERRFHPYEWRQNDAECKTLEILAAGLEANSTGSLELYTELPVCRSCQLVVEEFQKMFPGITVHVTSG